VGRRVRAGALRLYWCGIRIERQKRTKIGEAVLVDATVHATTLLDPLDQIRLSEDLEVVRHSGLADADLFG